MTTRKTNPADTDELRRQAEKVARENIAQAPEDVDSLSLGQERRLLHELRVHQIELEMQNEELRRTQVELDAARAWYFDLYDLAPVGYVTVSEKGLILESNLTAATLLGTERSVLAKQPLSQFIFKEDHDIYYLHRNQLFETGEPQTSELRMRKIDGALFWAHMTATTAQETDDAPVCRIVLMDVTERKFQEEAHARTQARTTAILESISDAFFSMDNHMVVTNFNHAAEIALGRKSENVIGHNLFDAFPEARGSIFEEQYTQALKEKIQVSFETYFGVSPYENWYDVRVYPNPEGISVFFQLITERKQEKERLEAAHAKLEALWGIASLADATVKTVSDHILSSITRITQSEYGFYGFVTDDESVMTIHSWSGEAMKDCSMVDKPSRFPICKAGVWGEAIRGRKPLILNEYAAAHQGKRGLPEGHVFLTNILVVPFFSHGVITAVVAVANRTADYGQDDVDQIMAFLTSVQAISDSKRAEEALRETEARQSSMIANISDVIAIMDADGIIRYKSPNIERIFGWNPADLVGSDGWETVHPGDLKRIQSEFHDLLAEDRSSRTVEYRYKCKDGNYRTIQLTATNLIRDPAIGGVLMNYRDITERERAEAEKEKLKAQLLQSQKMEAVGQLAGGVAHDFNNLLQVILGYVDILQDDHPLNDAHSENLNVVRGAAEHAADLTRQLLAFSRRQIIQPVNLDISDLVHGVLKMISRVIGENIDLCYMPGDRLNTVHADKGQMEQTLMNLCVNARDAMPNGGSLTIETENIVIGDAFCREHPWATEGCYVLLVITDSGHGMDEATREHIFEPFFTTKGVGKGTGLGLATVYGIVKQHKGLIRVYSEPGKGTAFKIYLPSVEQAAEEVIPKAQAAMVGGTETILVAEDEESVRKLIIHILEHAGYTVLVACDGEEALRVFDEHSNEIDMSILDVMMPKLSGREVMDRIQAKCPRMRFLFSSGYSQNAIHTDFILKEGLRLIAKPYHRADILRVMREILDAPRNESV